MAVIFATLLLTKVLQVEAGLDSHERAIVVYKADYLRHSKIRRSQERFNKLDEKKASCKLSLCKVTCWIGVTYVFEQSNLTSIKPALMVLTYKGWVLSNETSPVMSLEHRKSKK